MKHIGRVSRMNTSVNCKICLYFSLKSGTSNRYFMLPFSLWLAALFFLHKPNEMEINNSLFELQIAHRSCNDSFFFCAVPLFRINVIYFKSSLLSIFICLSTLSLFDVLWLILHLTSLLRCMNAKQANKFPITAFPRYFIDFFSFCFTGIYVFANVIALISHSNENKVKTTALCWKCKCLLSKEHEHKKTFISIFHGLNAF